MPDDTLEQDSSDCRRATDRILEHIRGARRATQEQLDMAHRSISEAYEALRTTNALLDATRMR